MTHTMKHQTTGWTRRTRLVALGAVVAVAAILGPGTIATTRLGAASEVAGYSTVAVADTIRSQAMLAEVAAGRGRVSNTLESV
jgi:hypothetical protein